MNTEQLNGLYRSKWTRVDFIHILKLYDADSEGIIKRNNNY